LADKSSDENLKKKVINYRITQNLRTRLIAVIKNKDAKKSNKTMTLLGCSLEFFKKYIENQFKKGMTWENHSKYGWHLDHIKPCSSFDLTDSEQQKICFHYTNFQPLWWRDNLIKGSKVL
jgi:hypothetical protein